jgi:phospholipid transport system substrate-binding protein
VISTARTLALGLLVSALLARAAPAAAADAGPQEMIRKTVDDAFAVLRDPKLAGKAKRAERLAALRVVADRTFDWSEMARASLGAPWRTLEPAKRNRFVEIFKDVLAARYMDDINRFEGTEKVTVDGSKRDGDETIVSTTLITASHEHVPIDYRVRGEMGTFKIVDISIEEVSLVNHYRKTFSAALVNMTIDQLIDKLARQLPPAVKASETKKK